MAKKFLTVSTTLSAAVAASGTFTVGYPTGTDEDSFAGYGHKAVAIGNVMSSPGDFTLTFGSASITFTYAASKTEMPAGTKVSIDLNLPGNLVREMTKLVPNSPGVSTMTLVRVDLGSPLVADVNGIAEAQATTPAGDLTLQTRAGVAGFGLVGGAPFGRTLTVDADGANTAVLTITGTDYEGNVMVENITANGTSVVAGVKAFYTVTGISFTNSASNNVFVGFADVLGLPFYLPGVDDCPTVGEFEDGTIATAGTFVAGVDTAVTATTGDVRGTYVPNSATDGAKNFVLFIPSVDPEYQGQAQFTG